MANEEQSEKERIDAKKAKEIADNVVENKNEEELNNIFHRIYRVAGTGKYFANIWHKQEPYTYRIAKNNKELLEKRGFDVVILESQEEDKLPHVCISWSEDDTIDY